MSEFTKRKRSPRRFHESEVPEIRPHVNMRMRPSLRRVVDAEAERLGWTRSRLIEKVLLDYMTDLGHRIR